MLNYQYNLGNNYILERDIGFFIKYYYYILLQICIIFYFN